MRITYDGHVYRWGKAGAKASGISRYFHEVICRLPHSWIPTFLGVDPGQGNLPVHPKLIVSPRSPVKPRRWTQPIKRYWWSKRYLRGAAVFHPTYYNLTGDLRWSDIKCPVVVTAHDFIHAAYPTLMEEVGWTLKCQQAAFERADRIICVSNATKSDLLERFPQVKGPVDVIYHGTSFPVVRRERPDAAFERPTFLFVGARGGYKNFSFLLNAFAKVCTKHSTVHLQVAGHNFTTEERWQIYLLGLTDRVSLCALPDEEQLMSFYQSCVALLYPSMHEGFGIPPLEAMASGAIPVTTNRSSLPEVMGDCGVMLDANAEDQWVECILKLCSPSAWRTDLMERGWSRAQRFAWETTAQKHVEIYQTFR